MTRQEKITQIGQLSPSTFSINGQHAKRNHMSYFIIPVAHRLFDANPVASIEGLKKKGWSLQNELKDSRSLYPTDPASMNSIKQYIMHYMFPRIEANTKSYKEAFLETQTMLFEYPLDQLWTHEARHTAKATRFNLESLDLWIFNENIAFFTLKSVIAVEETASISEISSAFNQGMRDYRTLFVHTQRQCFSNKPEVGFIPFIDWLMSFVTDKKNLLNTPIQINDKGDIVSDPEFQMLFESSYYAKLITAIHIDEDRVSDTLIEDAFTDELLFMNIDGTSVLEEVPFHLAVTNELFPSKMWESNEEYIHQLVGEGGINIWKYWSGIVTHDALAFFSIKEGSSGIVNHARHSYYFIYILNLYVNFTLRYFEHKLIDKDFISIENLRPIFTDLQRLRNQFMGSEISTRFQPNIIHSAIKNAMKQDDMFDEIKENVEVSLELTQRNTDLIITIIISVFTFGGVWINQEALSSFFMDHMALAMSGLAGVLVLALFIIQKRSAIIRFLKGIRRKVSARLKV